MKTNTSISAVSLRNEWICNTIMIHGILLCMFLHVGSNHPYPDSGVVSLQGERLCPSNINEQNMIGLVISHSLDRLSPRPPIYTTVYFLMLSYPMTFLMTCQRWHVSPRNAPVCKQGLQDNNHFSSLKRIKDIWYEPATALNVFKTFGSLLNPLH